MRKTGWERSNLAGGSVGSSGPRWLFLCIEYRASPIDGRICIKEAIARTFLYPFEHYRLTNQCSRPLKRRLIEALSDAYGAEEETKPFLLPREKPLTVAYWESAYLRRLAGLNVIPSSFEKLLDANLKNLA